MRALEIGREWLGHTHPAVEALQIGVAVHHRGLPNPFRRELELLLSEGVLKVAIASPTLSQGLNLNAAVLLLPGLYRSSKLISGEEFANVAGRAGRAFIDVEGLVVHVMFRGDEWRLSRWRELVESARSRALTSGLIQIVAGILERLARGGLLEREDAFEYLANSREAWVSKEKEVQGKNQSGDEEDGGEPLSQLVEKLDTAVFGLIEALDAESADLSRLLDEALRGSLWARQIQRETEAIRKRHKSVLEARARLIWSNTTPAARRGHFAMGVGLEAGLKLDAMADELAVLIDQADTAAVLGDKGTLAATLVELARHILKIRPFVPDKKNTLPQNWEHILTQWVMGVDVRAIGPANMAVVEDAFAYRLVWGLEALRTRRLAHGWVPDTIVGGGAASLETGVPQFMMAMLVRAGLPSRQAAITAVLEGNALFYDLRGMRRWLESPEVETLTEAGAWPAPETAALWRVFRDDVLGGETQEWQAQDRRETLDLRSGARPPDGIYRVEIDELHGDAWVCTPDYRPLVRLGNRVRAPEPSLFSARLVEQDDRVQIQCFGPGRATWF